MSSLRLLRLLATLATAATAAVVVCSAEPRRPNILFIVADDLGYGEPGCYGGTDIPTPHLDALAAGGVRFTHGYVTAAFCAASRAALLTGRYQTRFGFEFNPIGAKNAAPGIGLPVGEKTVADHLRATGYATALVGKWHLGGTAEFHPQRRGFDEFFGFLHEGHTYVPHPWEGVTTWLRRRALPDGGTGRWTSPDGRLVWTTHMGGNEPDYDADNPLLRSSQPVDERANLTDAFTREANDFITRHRTQPFFLYLAYNGPYSLGNLMLNESKNRHAAYYADKELQSFPRDAMHPWQHANKQFHNTAAARRRMASEISGVDDGVGEIMAALKANGLDENTLVVYSSDQGWMGGQNGMWGMGDHFRPTGAHELMMQIPLIFRQPGKIPAAQTCDALVSNYDFLPSLLNHLNLGQKMPQQPKSPGRDFSPALRGETLPHWDNTIFYEMETTRAIRAERWKYVVRFPDGPYELYDMENDPQERFNLFGQPGTEETRADMARRLNSFFDRYAAPKYDIWHGGGSKAKRHTQ